MRLVVGLRPVSDTLDKPDLARWAEPRLRSHGWVAGCRTAAAWNLGWAGWAELCLGGLLDGQYTLGPEAGWRVAGWAGPVAGVP